MQSKSFLLAFLGKGAEMFLSVAIKVIVLNKHFSTRLFGLCTVDIDNSVLSVIIVRLLIYQILIQAADYSIQQKCFKTLSVEGVPDHLAIAFKQLYATVNFKTFSGICNPWS